MSFESALALDGILLPLLASAVANATQSSNDALGALSSEAAELRAANAKLTIALVIGVGCAVYTWLKYPDERACAHCGTATDVNFLAPAAERGAAAASEHEPRHPDDSEEEAAAARLGLGDGLLSAALDAAEARGARLEQALQAQLATAAAAELRHDAALTAALEQVPTGGGADPDGGGANGRGAAEFEALSAKLERARGALEASRAAAAAQRAQQDEDVAALHGAAETLLAEKRAAEARVKEWKAKHDDATRSQRVSARKAEGALARAGRVEASASGQQRSGASSAHSISAHSAHRGVGGRRSPVTNGSTPRKRPSIAGTVRAGNAARSPSHPLSPARHAVASLLNSTGSSDSEVEGGGRGDALGAEIAMGGDAELSGIERTPLQERAREWREDSAELGDGSREGEGAAAVARSVSSAIEAAIADMSPARQLEEQVRTMLLLQLLLLFSLLMLLLRLLLVWLLLTLEGAVQLT